MKTIISTFFLFCIATAVFAQAGRVKEVGGAVGGDTTFVDLYDTPGSFNGESGNYLKVNIDSSAVEFSRVPARDGIYMQYIEDVSKVVPSGGITRADQASMTFISGDTCIVAYQAQRGSGSGDASVANIYFKRSYDRGYTWESLDTLFFKSTFNVDPGYLDSVNSINNVSLLRRPETDTLLAIVNVKVAVPGGGYDDNDLFFGKLLWENNDFTLVDSMQLLRANDTVRYIPHSDRLLLLDDSTTVLYTAHRRTVDGTSSTATGKADVYRTLDWGETWERYDTIVGSNTNRDFFTEPGFFEINPSSSIEQKVALYGRSEGDGWAYVAYSTDNGVSWGKPRRLFSAQNSTSTVFYIKKHSLLIAARNPAIYDPDNTTLEDGDEKLNRKYMELGISGDGGYSWNFTRIDSSPEYDVQFLEPTFEFDTLLNNLHMFYSKDTSAINTTRYSLIHRIIPVEFLQGLAGSNQRNVFRGHLTVNQSTTADNPVFTFQGIELDPIMTMTDNRFRFTGNEFFIGNNQGGYNGNPQFVVDADGGIQRVARFLRRGVNSGGLEINVLSNRSELIDTLGSGISINLSGRINFARKNVTAMSLYNNATGPFCTASGVDLKVGDLTTSTTNASLDVRGDAYIQDELGVGQATPSAKLHIAAGMATAGDAPLKFAAGTNLTTPESGALEFDGTNFFGTAATTRYTFAKTLTATTTLDFGSTSAQNSTDLTITITGAADGDVVTLGVPNTSVNADSNFSAWVSAADTVTIRFNNYSSGAIDPVSGTFRVSVIKY